MTTQKVELATAGGVAADAANTIPDIDSSAETTSYAADEVLTEAELKQLKSSRDFYKLLKKKDFEVKKFKNALDYEQDLRLLQGELVKLQRWAQEKKRRIAIIFEGRDAAGKGGTIRRFVEHLNPRAMRIVALPKPSAEEVGQWYFQRYAKQLPNEEEIVFFDRSWYNRAVVEPVNKFCTLQQYKRFMRQVPEFEHMLYEDGIDVIKFWFSISKQEQLNRFESRKINPLKQWKLSPIDKLAQELWSDYTKYKEMMFSKTHTTFSPWVIVKANNKKRARLESIRHVLSTFDYDGKDRSIPLLPDPNIIMRYHRSGINID
ncbi:polyphosphate kinase 2 [Pseudomonadota bacterium]